ncbi:3-phosphoglycerate dehydrogenase [Tissierella creatinini]|nr:3-phosphoglycerate dehydrogenase [Tissierella creatinini]TJX66753.1 3-phosphoglycerate dehydrogenase [Soehngenia saccharolytica]
MMRILANDGLDNKAIDIFKEKNFEIDTNHYEIEDLKKVIVDYDILIVRSATKVKKDLIDAAKGSKLKLIIRAGVGLDNIDVKYANSNDITVKNTPNSSSNSVAELVLGHMFGLARHIVLSNLTMRQGQWNKSKYTGIELSGKTLGIIGFGRIGKALAGKASALGMNIVYYDRFKNENESYTFMSLNELLVNSDFITLHVSATDRPLIGKEEIDMMKNGVVIINTARGGVIDEEALLNGLNENKVGGAGIDVFEEEPSLNAELINHPKVSVTPHIGAATFEAQERIGEEVVEIVLDFYDNLANIAS